MSRTMSRTMSYTPTSKISLSVVLPAFNEAENIGRVIANAVEYLSDRQIPYEIIVVNDGSTDGTKAIVAQLCAQNNNIHLINHPRNLGYGSALRSGFDQAVNEYIFLTDGDGQFAIGDLDRFMPYLGNSSTNSQIIIGYRAKRADIFVRSLNAWMYHLFIQCLLGLRFRDIDCAFKLFPRSIYQTVKPIQSNGALFSAEFLMKLQQLQNIEPIIELPVQHFPRQFGVATGANIKVILRMFWECWQLKQSCRNSHQIQLNPDQLSGMNQMR